MARISAPTSASTARRLFSLRWEGAGGGGGGGEEIEKSGAFLLVRAGKGPWQGTSKAFPMAIKKKQKKQRGAALIRRPRPSARLPPTSPRGRDRRSQFVGWRVATRPWLLPQLRSGLSAARPAAQNWEPPQPIKLLCGRAPAPPGAVPPPAPAVRLGDAWTSVLPALAGLRKPPGVAYTDRQCRTASVFFAAFYRSHLVADGGRTSGSPPPPPQQVPASASPSSERGRTGDAFILSCFSLLRRPLASPQKNEVSLISAVFSRTPAHRQKQ